MRCFLTSKGLNKMNDLTKYIIERMVERMVEGTCAVMLHMLKSVPGFQGVNDKAVDIGEYPSAYVPNHFKTQGMCIKAVEADACTLKLVPDQYKTQKMCDDAKRKRPWLLNYVPDWFITKQQVN